MKKEYACFFEGRLVACHDTVTEWTISERVVSFSMPRCNCSTKHRGPSQYYLSVVGIHEPPFPGTRRAIIIG